MSTLRTNAIQTVAGKQLLNSTGSIINVVQTVKQDVWSSASNGTSFYPITGYTATITPTSTASKILIICNMFVTSGYWEIQGRLTRNGADITGSWGNARGSRTRCSFATNQYENAGSQQYSWSDVHYTYLDSPSTTSATTYGVSLNGYSTFTIAMNYNVYVDSDSADYYGQPSSTITLMEVVG